MDPNINIQRLAESRGVELQKKRGGILVGKCPFHDSRSTTLTINPKANTWACSGKCRVKDKGPVEWIAKAEGISQKHALELLKQGYVPGEPTEVKKATIRKLDLLIEPEQPDAAVMAAVIEHYQSDLKQSEEAQAYLKTLKLDAPDALELLRVGFAGRTLGYRIPEKNRKAGKALRGQLRRLGLLRDTGHEHFTGCIVVPFLDDEGVVQQIYGHRVGKSLRGEPLELWLHEPTPVLYNISRVMPADVVVVSNILDALAIASWGVTSVTVIESAEHLTKKARQSLRDKRISRVLIAYPRTPEGDEEALKLGRKIAPSGITAFRVKFPHGMSALDHRRHKDEQGAKGLEVLVRSATWIAGTKAEQPVQQPREAPPNLADVQVNHEGISWRVRGLEDNRKPHRLHVNVMASRGECVHVDVLDLYNARQRAVFTKQAHVELGVEEPVVRLALGKVLLHLEQLQAERATAEELAQQRTSPTLNQRDREAALRLLRGKHLVDRIVDAFKAGGIAGEEANLLMAYLATVSRKMSQPLGVILQSSSAAGKSSLMDAVLALVPEEERVEFSAMTGQSLYYLQGSDLRHKVLAISEDEGVRRSSYALKLLQSDGHLTIASTSKDDSARLVTQTYTVQGPVQLLLTTTRLDVDPELANRCLVLSVDESPRQTAAIHEQQRQQQTLQGLLQQQGKGESLHLLQNVQRLLEPVLVVNPLAPALTFEGRQTRARRDHMKYLTLIRAVTLLHQHQRPRRTVEHEGKVIEYIEVEPSDVELADSLWRQVKLGVEDELPPATAKVLAQVKALVEKLAKAEIVEPGEVRFSQRQLREFSGMGHTQTKVHLRRLVELEYVTMEGSGIRGRRFYTYEPDGPRWAAPGRPLGGPQDRPHLSNDPEMVEPVGGLDAGSHQGSNGKSARNRRSN